MKKYRFVIEDEKVIEIEETTRARAEEQLFLQEGGKKILSCVEMEIPAISDFLGIAEAEGVEITPELLVDLSKPQYNGRFTGGFFHAPASTRFHGAYEGGLYDHSRQVYERLKDLTYNNGLEWERKESPFIIGFFHDLCKMDSYYRIQKDTETVFAWNDAAEDKRHAEKSLALLEKHIELTDEERDCILYHMGPYANKKMAWDDIARLYANYDAAISRHENVMWTHMADMLASKIDRT